MKLLEQAIGPVRELVFLDLEGTQTSHETIAIGACSYICDEHLLPVKGKPIKIFKRFIRASSKVGKVVSDLTGITEDTLVSQGIDFNRAISELIESTKIPGGKRKYITFGNQDIVMLKASTLKDTSGKAMAYYNHIRRNWFDFQDFVSRYVFDGRHVTYSQPKLLQIFEAEDLKHAHDPLYDAENLKNLFIAVSTKPEILIEWFLKNVENSRHSGKILKPIVDRLLSGETISPEKFSAFLKEYFG
ncbi:MAG TPA: hypothetical protein DEA32_01675 [Firmicutes bacterium]|nr:hypothetical protein [Bacillota bacterium]